MHNIVMCMNQSDSIVIIPTYNEKENVENIIRAVFALEKCFHILIIDDGSPDGTASIVQRLQAEEFADRLFLIERQGKLGLGTAYITGFKCYRRKVLETIPLDQIRFKGYGFQIEMKYTAYKIGFKIKEVPVVFVNRQEGVSKMSGGIFGEAFFGVMRLRWDGWFRKYPKISH